jgi:hypothetical protein
MKNMTRLILVAAVVVLALPPLHGVQAQQTDMTFFITSVGSGKGADLGGLKSADQHCQELAQAVGAGSHTWHAYLSTSAYAAALANTIAPSAVAITTPRVSASRAAKPVWAWASR